MGHSFIQTCLGLQKRSQEGDMYSTISLWLGVLLALLGAVFCGLMFAKAAANSEDLVIQFAFPKEVNYPDFYIRTDYGVPVQQLEFKSVVCHPHRMTESVKLKACDMDTQQTMKQCVVVKASDFVATNESNSINCEVDLITDQGYEYTMLSVGVNDGFIIGPTSDTWVGPNNDTQVQIAPVIMNFGSESSVQDAKITGKNIVYLYDAFTYVTSTLWTPKHYGITFTYDFEVIPEWHFRHPVSDFLVLSGIGSIYATLYVIHYTIMFVIAFWSPPRGSAASAVGGVGASSVSGNFGGVSNNHAATYDEL